MNNIIKIAVCQLAVTTNAQQNIEAAFQAIEQVATQGAQVVLLPEIFVCPYDVSVFRDNIHNEGSALFARLKKISGDKKILLIAGSVPEEENGKLYNTSYIFEDGKYLGKHRKFHLFDINIPGKMVFRESDIFTPGERLTVLETKFGKIGVMICFDLRFPEMARLMSLQGAQIIFAPAVFNTVTGPLHWELVLRSRAVDAQCFLCACSPALNEELAYKAWGCSAIVDPWGKVLKMCQSKPTTIVQEINLDDVDEARNKLPILTSARLLPAR
jgi:predicted amidohydrolase